MHPRSRERTDGTQRPFLHFWADMVLSQSRFGSLCPKFKMTGHVSSWSQEFWVTHRHFISNLCAVCQGLLFLPRSQDQILSVCASWHSLCWGLGLSQETHTDASLSSIIKVLCEFQILRKSPCSPSMILYKQSWPFYPEECEICTIHVPHYTWRDMCRSCFSVINNFFAS